MGKHKTTSRRKATRLSTRTMLRVWGRKSLAIWTRTH